MGDSLNSICFGCQRHHLTLQTPAFAHAPTASGAKKYPKAYMNHILGWPGFQYTKMPSINKILLHSTSGTICTSPELYGSLSFALSCCSGSQTPCAVKSKRSVASFKVMKGTLIGARSTLRALDFCYKWTFLSASEELDGRASASVGTNVFTFELGLHDYKAYEPLPGLYVQFDQSLL